MVEAIPSILETAFLYTKEKYAWVESVYMRLGDRKSLSSFKEVSFH